MMTQTTDDAKILVQQARESFARGDIIASIAMFQKVIAIYESLGQVDGMALANNDIGYVYRSAGKSEQAIEFLEKSVEQYDSIGDVKGSAMPLANLAGTFRESGSPARAIKPLLEIVERLESISDYDAAALARIDAAESMLETMSDPRPTPVMEMKRVATEAKETLAPAMPRLTDADPRNVELASRVMAQCDHLLKLADKHS